jgi:hypothetical protein|tara:strand:- start:194 stop:412 length:219 start_codon:yes stop_codon:yes gene_type:complete
VSELNSIKHKQISQFDGIRQVSDFSDVNYLDGFVPISIGVGPSSAACLSSWNAKNNIDSQILTIHVSLPNDV